MMPICWGVSRHKDLLLQDPLIFKQNSSYELFWFFFHFSFFFTVLVQISCSSSSWSSRHNSLNTLCSPMARYSFVVLKVPLNTSKTNTIICQQSFLLLYSARRTTIHNAERSERDLLVTAKLLNILGTRDQGLKMFGIAVVLPFPPSFPFPSVPSPLLYHPVPSFTLPFP